MKYWELEFFAYNFATGNMELVKILTHFIIADNFEDANMKLKIEGEGWWRLTVVYYNNLEDIPNLEEIPDEELVDEGFEYNTPTDIGKSNGGFSIQEVYDMIMQPDSLKNMDFFKFYDWLSRANKVQINKCLSIFEHAGLEREVDMTKAIINRNFNEKK